MPSRLPDALLVAVGGAFGSLGRWSLAESFGTPATLAVNLSGCLVIGVLAGWAFDARPRPAVP